MAASSVVRSVPQHQVFLNFRGKEVRQNFISHLESALRAKDINFFIDTNVAKGNHLNILFKEIEQSRIALAIFSKGYTDSDWCLNELLKITERMNEGKLATIPIFYLLKTGTVKHQEGAFGDALRKQTPVVGEDLVKKWEGALKSVCEWVGFTYDGKSGESQFIAKIVQAVLEMLSKISPEASTERSLDPSQDTEVTSGKAKCFGLVQRLEELTDKVDSEGNNETRIIGVVGMHGIGKTTLVKNFYKTWKPRFASRGLLEDISGLVKLSNCNLPGMLLRKLLKRQHIDIDEVRYGDYKNKLLEEKVFIVLDGVNSKKQIEVILERHHDWTRKGSLIVIATSDRSLLQDVVKDDADIYVVPQLNHRDGLKHFRHYAFDHSVHENDDKEDFMKLSKDFVHHVRGHPLTLELLGEELRGKPVAYWKDKLNSRSQSLSPSIRDRVLQVSYDELSKEQKDAFLDIACFRSHDLVYVESLLDSPSSPTIIKALMDKFLINTSDSSQVEMHDLLYTFATEISKANGNGRHQCDINYVFQKQKEDNSSVRVKGIFFDLSHMKKKNWTLQEKHFKTKRGLRYIKFFSSHCLQECNPRQQIYIPGELDFPLEEVRCLHWLNYPLKELPTNFNPKNLVDLKLPYSEVEQIWKDKDAPKLKWVDLNHSSKLKTLSGISKAQNLQRLNLEGCMALKTLDPDMQNMESLVFLNLKGCTALESFPDIKLVSLKTLILSNCSKLESFLVISEILEVLYLDGTAITELPTTMVKLVKLNIQDCEKLKKLPEEFDKLKVLQELVCSGCKKLSSLPDVMKNMKCLQILLLDGTAITKIPRISSLERLCLSGIDEISLSDDISQLSQLKWLDLKYCKNLLYIPKLPPNLQCLDAHGCASLKRVANPMASHLPIQIHSSFIFTNCNKLGRIAHKEITTYAQRKCQMLSDALKCCNEGFGSEALFSTCFPGCEVPSWFSHEAVGSVLMPTLPAHWNENKFVGIALCAVVSSPNCQEEIKSFSVTCKFGLKSKDGLRISFDRLVGHWNKVDKMKSDHVFICYTRCSNNINCLEAQHSGTCIPITASLEFGVTDEKAKLEVLKCGLRLVYASDEPPQKTNSDVTTKTDTNDAEFYKTSQTDEEIELQVLTPVRNVSFNSNGNGSVSPSGEDSTVSYEESRIGR